MNQKLVTIQTFNTVDESIVCRTFLEDNGINAFIPDENTVRANWNFGLALGGIRLQVAEADAERSIALLKESWETATIAADDRSLDDLPPISHADELIRYAWRAAVLGCAVPFVLALYSTKLVADAKFSTTNLSDKGKRMMFITMILNAGFSIAWAFGLGLMN
jgi:hypothetical protein